MKQFNQKKFCLTIECLNNIPDFCEKCQIEIYKLRRGEQNFVLEEKKQSSIRDKIIKKRIEENKGDIIMIEFYEDFELDYEQGEVLLKILVKLVQKKQGLNRVVEYENDQFEWAWSLHSLNEQQEILEGKQKEWRLQQGFFLLPLYSSIYSEEIFFQKSLPQINKSVLIIGIFEKKQNSIQYLYKKNIVQGIHLFKNLKYDQNQFQIGQSKIIEKNKKFENELISQLFTPDNVLNPFTKQNLQNFIPNEEIYQRNYYDSFIKQSDIYESNKIVQNIQQKLESGDQNILNEARQQYNQKRRELIIEKNLKK